MSELKRTPLYDAHVAAGATMVDFGGWEMPIQYPAGIIAEHLYTRSHCGIFDVSHMGRLIIEGPGRVDFLQHVLTSDVSALVPGRAQYCMIPNENGGLIDDAYLYMFDEEKYMLVVNASNAEKDIVHLSGIIGGYDCKMINISAATSSIAVQGPDTDNILKTLSGSDFLTDDKKNALNTLDMEGRTVQIARTGYTGEPVGYELFIDAAESEWLWNRLIELGAHPTGLGARDTLRTEAGLPLYGHEMGVDPDGNEIPAFAVPLARFAVSFSEAKGAFIGREALAKQHAAYERTRNGDFSDVADLPKRIYPIALVDRGVMRAGMPVFANGQQVGWVSSGTMIPYYEFDGSEAEAVPTEKTGKRSVGFAYIASDLPKGTPLEVDVRGKKLKAKKVLKHIRQDMPPYARPVIAK